MADSGVVTRQGSTIPNEDLSLAPKQVDRSEHTSDSEAEASKGQRFELGLHLDGVPLIDKFVNRPLQMEQIREKLLPYAENDGRRVVVIYGEAEVGKTQLSIEFARTNGHDFSSVFFVDGSTEESLKWDIAAIQQHLKGNVFSPEAQSYARSSKNLSRAVDEVLQWFSIKGNHRWLLVIDNLVTQAHSSGVDPKTYKLEPYFPTADQGRILITTCGRQGEQYGFPVELYMMDIDQAESLLAEQVGRPSQELGEPGQIKELLDLLGRHPIAIKQAGAFIMKTNASISDYLQRYQDTLIRLKKSGNAPNCPKESVLVTTTISYDHIVHKDEVAASFLKLWTYLDNRDLWYELFTPDFPLPVESESLWWFRSTIQTKEGFAKAMHTLQAYDMIQAKQNSSGYFLHPVISESALQTIFEVKDPEFAWLAVRTVGRATPSGSAQDDLVLKRRLKLHAERCYRLVVDNVAVPYFTLKNPFLPKGVKLDTALIYTSAVYRLGKLYGDKQMTVEANELLLRASQRYSEILGAENAVTLDAVSSRAVVLDAGGKLDEAEEVYLQVLKGYENTVGPSASLTWKTAYALGLVQQKLGKLDDAERMYRSVLNTLESTVGPDHPLTIRVVGLMAGVCSLQNRLDEAGEFYLRALPVERKARGLEYFMILAFIHDLALIHLGAGRPAEAEKMALICLQEYEGTSVSDISLPLETVAAIGELYREQGKLDEAERMLLRVLEGYEKTPNDQQEKIANTAYNLANFYTVQSKTEEAKIMILKAVQGYKSTLGADHHYTLDALNNLAIVLDRQGKKLEAEETYLQVLESKERTLGPGHRKTLETVNNLGVIYAGQDKFVEAEKMYLRALDGYKTALGPSHSITLGVLINMSGLYNSQDRRRDAAKALLQALDGYEEVLLRFHESTQGSDDRPADAGSASALGGNRKLLYAQYSSTGDEELSAFIPGLTMTINELEELGHLQIGQEEWMDAEDLYLRLSKGKELALGLGHSSTEDTIRALGTLLFYRFQVEYFSDELDSQETTDRTQSSSRCWAEPSPIWRLAHLAETYGQSCPDIFGVLGKALLQVGDENNARVALQFEVRVAMNITGDLRRCCDRCETSITPQTGRFVCKTCNEDTDICETCFKSPDNEQWQSHPCHDHEFLSVFSADSASNEVSGVDSDPASWLSDLKVLYVVATEQEKEAPSKSNE